MKYVYNGFIWNYFTNFKSTSIGRLLISFVFLFVFFLNGYAQIPELRLKYFSKEEGLFNLNINYATQDSIGFIWIASNNGLYKYDGFDLIGYHSNQNDSSTLSNNNISYLYNDSKGILWVGAIPGLCRYNRDLDNFERCDDLNRFSDIVDKNVTQISEDKKGNLLISCNNYIFKYNGADRKFSPLLSIKNGEIKHFLVDKSNTIWIACSNKQGLKKFNLNTQKWEQILPAGNDNNDLSNSSISYLSLDNNKLWMATLGEGIKMLDIKSLKYTRYSSEKGDASVAIFTYIDNKKNLWTVDFTGLKLFDKRTGTFIGYYPKLNDPKSIKDEVKGLFQDKQGNYWIYHGPKGIGVSMALKGFRYFDKEISDFWHTSSENISALQEDSNGNLWIGYADGGISVFKYQQRITLNYQHNENDKFSLGKGGINCIFLDSKGIIWLSSYYLGLQYFDDKSGKFISYNHNPEDSNSIAGNDIRSIAEDNEGNLWLAVHGKGVDKFDRKRAKFIHYNSLLNRLSKDWTYEILIDYRGDLWVATSWGLGYLKKGDTMFKSFYAETNDTTSLSNSFINTIYEDNNHILWVGTASGLNQYNRDRNNFKRFDKIFVDNNISGILSDKDNNLWISTLSGLAMFNYKNKQVKNFGLFDGLISDEFNPRSCFKTQFNEFFFGGTKGIVIFKPHELAYNTTLPFVFIDKIKILNKEIKISDSDHKLQKQISRTEKITLSYSDKVITISYKALNFINPQYNQYAYKLEGFDKNWNFVGTTREANYTNLDPGTYTFRVKASNNDGYWNNKGASIEIIILPPWWKTWWFYLISFLSIIFLIFIYIKRREKKFIEEKRILEEKVRERTKEIQQQKNEIEIQRDIIDKKNDNITSSIKYASNIQNAIFPPIELIDKLLPDNFILSKPKEIVSGDFYWVAEKENKIIIAVADCTGHGVPGAFMSVLGVTLLNEIVNQGIIKSDIIVTKLRERVIHSLQQGRKDTTTLDGMDISLCVLDRQEKKVQFTGGMNNLVYIHDRKLNIVKADRLSVSSLYGSLKPSTIKEFNYSIGDVLYLFSDGYQDQFGGIYKKKYSIRQFYNSVLKIYELPMYEQKKLLLKEIIGWMGDTAQTDDITVMGIRL